MIVYWNGDVLSMEFVTIGECMVAFFSQTRGYLRYQSAMNFTVAGAESNVAIGMSKLGHTAGWISKVGKDEFAEVIRMKLRSEGVDLSALISDPNHPTGIMFKQVDSQENTSVFYYRSGSAASTMSPSDIDEKYIAEAKIVHVTGITCALGQGCIDAVNHMIDLAKANGALVSFDPNIRLKLMTKERAKEVLTPLLSRSDIVLIGDDEADILLGTHEPDEVISQLRQMGVSQIALKLGGKGAVVADANSQYTIPPVPITVVDTVGAGDAFASGFLSGVLEGKSIEECGKMGGIMGAFAVSSLGDIEGLPSREQFDNYRNHQSVVLR